MKRLYETGESENVTFFLGKEVERTIAHGMNTLFVVGVHDPETIKEQMDRALVEGFKVEHIYFGANMSFEPATIDELKKWEDMIVYFLKHEMLCTLDFHVKYYEECLDTIGLLNEYDTFISMISVKLPYVRLNNMHTCIKIDDRGFRSTNEGVWVHKLYSMFTKESFTYWNQYKQDKILK